MNDDRIILRTTVLTDLDLAILTIESGMWRFEGAKREEIRTRTGLSPVGYYARLNQLLDNPEALAHDPRTITRCRRWRDNHRQQILKGNP